MIYINGCFRQNENMVRVVNNLIDNIATSSSSFGFSHQWSSQRIFLLQLCLSTVSSSITSTSAMSSFTTSINLLFGLPRFLFPGNSILSILLPIYPSSFLCRCPYHLSLVSRVFSPNFPTCAVPLMYSFLIILLSILVTPNENRSIYSVHLCHLHLRLLSFRQCHCLQPVQHCWSHCHLVHLPFHSSWYSPVADHS